MGAPFITALPTFTHEDMGYLVSFFLLWLLTTVGASTLGFRSWKEWYSANRSSSVFAHSYFWISPGLWTFFYFFVLPCWILAGFLNFYSGEVYYGDEIDPSVSTVDERVWFTGVAFHLLSCAFIIFWANLFFVARNRPWTFFVALLATASTTITGVIFWIQFAWAGGWGTPMTVLGFVYFIIVWIEVFSGRQWLMGGEVKPMKGFEGAYKAGDIGATVLDGAEYSDRYKTERQRERELRELEAAEGRFPGAQARFAGSAFLPNEFSRPAPHDFIQKVV